MGRCEDLCPMANLNPYLDQTFMINEEGNQEI
jgi:hypothetical protein